ncbi:MAG: FAD-dependent oxidoreductase [Actinomycetota bacterium]|nr:FAD-dependent oxidoreductase [Actinomycetota bacterium]
MVLVGGGLASATAARTLREEGYEGSIRLIGREPEPPYLRPPLSKRFLAGKDDKTSVFVEPPAFYADHDVELILSEWVESVRPQVLLAGGRHLGYDRLLLAPGASPRHLAIPGEDLAGVHVLRTLDDSRRLRERLITPSGARVVVVGTGWIGMEVAATANELGNEVTVVGRGAVPLSSALGDRLGTAFRRRHERAGTIFHMRSLPSEILGSGGTATGVRLTSGDVLPADVVVIAVGARPNVELALSAGLPVEDGIVVDVRMRTPDQRIVGAGDAVSPFSPLLGARHRNEHWDNAIKTGQVAARTMLGIDASLDGVPYFYTDQFDWGMEWWGFPPALTGATLVLRGEPDSGSFVAFWVRSTSGGFVRVVGGMHVNDWDAAGEIQERIRSVEGCSLAELGRPLVREQR